MKKLFVLLVLIFFIGCSKENIETINYNTLYKKLENKESFVVIFSNKSNNSDLEDTLSKVLVNNNLQGFKIYTDRLDSKEITDLKYKIDYEDPSIVFVINGNDPSVLSHITNEEVTAKEIEERLEDMNFIK